MNNTTVRLGLAAAVVVLAVFLGINYLSGSNVGNDPEASPSPSTAASAAASARPLPIAQGTELTAGTYFLRSFPVQLTVKVPTFEAPAVWFAGCAGGGVVEQGVCSRSTPTAPVFAVDFLIVDNVVADPCSAGGELLDPPVGPTVDDLVTAISSLEGFEATAPLDVTVDGFHGKAFTLTAPATPPAGCDLRTWATAQRTNGMGPGESIVLRILDVDGTRVVITAAYGPETSEADISAVQQLLASVRIAP